MKKFFPAKTKIRKSGVWEVKNILPIAMTQATVANLLYVDFLLNKTLIYLKNHKIQIKIDKRVAKKYENYNFCSPFGIVFCESLYVALR